MKRRKFIALFNENEYEPPVKRRFPRLRGKAPFLRAEGAGASRQR
ncbi:hypothetical protein HMPREF7215_0754 [Pyramidobacter piscolens W5455]|uniref:Uncharacterized protein n=1 Tax=Pyramidobacter piscolens W5455 TaxID=352165 RepID=A0ABM9ZXV0_9BACT|nr:hypothetical protein HMPREF7215_0754 [Pyramidobacter piscolens W5455]